MNKQRGVALIAAIFLVVIIGAAVVLLAVLSTRNSQQTTQSLLQIRAQQAASAALEYGVQRLIENPVDCTLDQTVVVPAYAAFTIKLNCRSDDYLRPSQQITLFQLEAVAEYGTVTSADYVWAQLDAQVEL